MRREEPFLIHIGDLPAALEARQHVRRARLCVGPHIFVDVSGVLVCSHLMSAVHLACLRSLSAQKPHRQICRRFGQHTEHLALGDHLLLEMARC